MQSLHYFGPLLLCLAVAGQLVLADDIPGRSPSLGERDENLPKVRWISTPSLVQLAPEEPQAIDSSAFPEPQTLPVQPNGESSPEPEPVHGLTLDDLVELAMQFNPTLIQAAATMQAAEGRRLQAGLYPNPDLVYIADEVGNNGTQGLQGMGVVQEFVTKGKRRLASAAADSAVEQAQYAWQAQQQRVLNDVRSSYYQVLVAQKTIDVDEKLVGISNEGVQVTEKLRAASAVSQVDVLQANIEAERAQLRLNIAQNRYRAAWRRLGAVLGCPAFPIQPVTGDVESNLPVFEWEDTLDQILAQSPELARRHAAAEQARRELALQCANRYPNFAVEAAVKYDTGSYDSVADVAVVLPLQLFNRNQGNILAAQSNLIVAEREIQRLELDLRDRLALAYEQYANARRQVDAYKDTILPHAKASLALVSMGYREGEFGYLELLTAQRTFFGANLAYLESLQQLWTQSVELEGLLLSGGLQTPE